MQLTLIGVHQRDTPVEIRERLAFATSEVPEALVALHQSVDEAFILSTCNRVEICAVTSDAPAGDAVLKSFLAASRGIDQAAFESSLYVRQDAEAIRHLYRLAAGLDSMVLGEDQIVGQLKEALAVAHAGGTIGPVLHRALHGALAAGKQVRTQTGISTGRVSVVSVALEEARHAPAAPPNQRFLVIGAGRMAELALKHLRAEPSGLVTLVNRTSARAEALARRYDAVWRPFAELPAVVREHDVVLSCTAAPEIILDAATIARAAQGRTAPLLLFDLAVPRDIEHSAGEIPGVRLFDVDTLEPVCNANRASRAAEMRRAEALVDDEVRKFAEWWSMRQALPTIRALRERAEAIRDAEIRRALARCPELSPQQRDTVEALSAAIVNKLLHDPTIALRDPHSGTELVDAVHRLFNIAP